MSNLNMNRRSAMASLLALSATGALAACGQGGSSEIEAPAEIGSETSSGFFTASEMALIAALAQTIIPATETGGAVEAGVPDTLQEMATTWANEGVQQFWRTGLTALDASLTEANGAPFTPMSAAEQATALGAYDAQVYDGEVEDGFYRAFKATIVRAYYMSEIGAADELAYEPVPGEWIGCVPLSEFPKTWAT